jgi:hypothetical protein
VLPRTAAARMAAEVLKTCLDICKFFYDQKQLNTEAKCVLADLADYVMRLLQPLQSLDTRGLESGTLQLYHLWGCLKECKRIYEKYKEGWNPRKGWVLPYKILAKAKTQEERARHAWQDLSTVLAIVNHNTMQPSALVGSEAKIDDTWELDVNSVQINLDLHRDPIKFLGRGSSGVVGQGTLTRDGIAMPVAVKMALSNKRFDAKCPATGKNTVDDFGREVRLLATMDHPNIVQCFGSITHKDGACVMWIVMEVLDFTLFTAIKGKKIQIGRDDPQTYVDFVEGICSALAYLHTAAGKPIVHRDLKPENIMIKSLEERVVKLIDFDMVKETQTGVGSTMSTKGTREYMSPEILRNGGCSIASDMWAFALVALFIFSGKTPTESSVITKIEKSPHPKANFTQELMAWCLNERPERRPAASMVSFSLDGYEEKPAATAGIENTIYWNLCSPVARFVRQVT